MITFLIPAIAITAISLYLFISIRKKEPHSPKQIEKVSGYSEDSAKNLDFCYEIRKGLYLNVCKHHTPSGEPELEQAIDRMLRTGSGQEAANQFTPFCKIWMAGTENQDSQLGTPENRQVLKEKLLAMARRPGCPELSVHYAQLVADEPLAIYLSKKEKDKLFDSLNAHFQFLKKFQVLASVQHSDNIGKSFRIYILLSMAW